jgi:hypothetical protein
VVAETRDCEQCGASFVPRREHARFCSPSCRAAWNREHSGDLKAGMSALQWSITAMNDAALRISQVAAWDQARAFAAIGEAVWWVTIVDATLVRHHLDAYDRIMADRTPAQRQLIEQTLAGLRFVRNRIGDEADLAEFIEPSQDSQDSSAGWITGWTWKPVPESKVAKLSPHGRAWEVSRYQAFQAQLAGHSIGETFGRATAFLKRAVTDAPALTDDSAQAGR